MSSERVIFQANRSVRVFPEHPAPHRSAHPRPHRDTPRSLRVMKFGGTSVGDASCIRQVVEIIKNNARDGELVVVVSAMSSITNKLIEAATHAEARNRGRAAEILEEVRQKHETAVRASIPCETERDRVQRKISDLLEECGRWCDSTAALGELTPRMRDSISSLGERLSVPLVAAALSSHGLSCEPLEATDLIVTDSSFGSADPKMDLTAERCERRLRPLLRKGIIPIVTGFIGADEDGALTTLGRGGSDYSATIVGAALKASEVIIWTDVDGILTADPRLVPGAVTIPEISYREASELAHFGAKVLHPKTLRPVMEDGIPVWIRNTFSPSRRGTKVTPIGNANRGGVKAVAAISDVALIKVGEAIATVAQDAIPRMLVALRAIRTDVLLVAKSPSHDQIMLVVAAASAQKTVDALRREFLAEATPDCVDDVSVDSAVAILTVVGENLRAVKDIVGRVLDELSQNGVHILANGQGSSGCNVSLVVARKDLDTALATTHREFERSTEVELPSGTSSNVAGEFADAAKILDEETFRSMIACERKRTERSRKPVLLMLLRVGDGESDDGSGKVLSKVLTALSDASRDTDVTGWYKSQSVVGVMFTETGMHDSGAIMATMMQRIGETLRYSLSLEKASQIHISLHVFPESWSQDSSEGNPTLYPDLEHREKKQRGVLASSA